jgi:outer membrane protein
MSPASRRIAIALAAAMTAAAPPVGAVDDGGAVELPAELSLETALKIGRARQPQLRQAHAQTEAAEARVDIARAPLLPQVNITANYTRATGNFVPRAAVAMPPTRPISATTFPFVQTGITVNQLIWDFGQAWQRRVAAREGAEAQEANEQAAVLSSDLSIRAAFYTARASRDAITVARETLANQTKHVEQIRAFTEVGTRPEIDLLQALTDQANAEVSLINAQNDYANARALLNQTMGVDAPASYEVTGGPSAALPGEGEGIDVLVDEALRTRPELASQLAQLRAQEATNKAIRGRYGPTIGAIGGLTYAGAELGNLVWNFSGGLTLQWPIFEGLATRSAEREGKANLSALRAALDIVRQQIRVDVDRARLTIVAGKAAVSAAERSIANAKARLDLAELRYRTGVGNGIELSDAQLAFTNAGFQKLQATLRLDTARAQLQQALGRM